MIAMPESFNPVDGVAYETCVFPQPKGTAMLCCLWDDVEHAAHKESGGFYMVGNCVSAVGVKMMLRTLLANPRIDTLVVRGADLTQTRGLIRRAMAGDLEVLDDELSELVQAVLMPSRQYGGAADVYRLSHDRPMKWVPMPPPPKMERTTSRGLPAERFTAETLWRVWPKLLRQAMLHGAVSGTVYGYRQRELLSPTWVFHGGATLAVGAPDWYAELLSAGDVVGKDRVGLDAYAESSMLNPALGDASYSYGHRLLGRWDDQVARAVEILSAQAEQRRVLLSTWDPGERGEFHLGLDAITRPSDMLGKHPPCLTQIWLRRDENGSLYTHASFRSHDLLRAGPANAWGVCRLAERVADRLGWEVGQVAITSHSAHVYEIDWEAAQRVGKQRGRWVFEDDPRGHLRVRPFDGFVVVELLGGDGQVLDSFSRKPGRAIDEALSRGWVTTLSHAAWLGRRCAEEGR